MLLTSLFCVFSALCAVCVRAQIPIDDINGETSLPRQRYVLGRFDNEDPEYYYLPKTITPVAYNIEVEPCFETNVFHGNVTVWGVNEEDINTIVLHSLNLEIHTIEVRVDQTWTDSFHHFDTEREFLIIDLIETIKADSVINVTIHYSGAMDTTQRTRGLYIAKYLDEFGVEKRLATTHMEPTNAREVFPCFDEPALKASISVTVVRPAHYNSKSNMDFWRTEPCKHDETKEVDYFFPSPPMSTYLVAIVVSEFATISSSYPGQGKHELYGDLADLKKNYGDLGLQSSRQVITALEDYTGVKYYLPKIGQVAIPEGYFGGAMENWGLVVYGESYLLFKPNVSTEIQRNGVVNIIAHEYAHQWFGNLVGPASWAYTWLNEGFATFFTMRIPAIVYPAWRYDEQFAWKLPYAMSQDAKTSTRPMTMPVGKPENIQSTFDVIAYDKSACVIRMFEHILGTDNFKAALHNYLATCQLKGATADHLTASFKQVLEGKNKYLAERIKTIFDTWHLQKGFPLVTVIRNYADNTVTLRQERFLEDGSASDEIYHIPLNFFTQTSTAEELADTSAQVWLDQKEVTIDLLPDTNDSYLLLNKHYTGYYRVNYDEENWKRIIEKERSFIGMPKNRVQLLEDAYTLMQAQLLSPEIALRLFSAIQLDDDNYLVVKTTMKYFDWLYEWYHADKDIMDYLSAIYRKAYDTYSKVEYDGDYIHTMMRNELLSRMCRINYQGCLADMDHHMRQDYVLQSPNLQESVVCAGMMNTSDADAKFRHILEIIDNTQEDEVKTRLMRAVTCSKDVEVGQKLLNWIVYPETNYLHWNVNTLMQYYCRDYENSERAIRYYLETFAILTKSYSQEALRSLLITIANKLNSADNVELIEKYVAGGSLSEEYEHMFQEAINVIKNNINKITCPTLFSHILQ